MTVLRNQVRKEACEVPSSICHEGVCTVPGLLIEVVVIQLVAWTLYA